jgi:hypothetical protein
MSTTKETTLRLHMPQWQGGNDHNYSFGAVPLAWLAPPANGPIETVSVRELKEDDLLNEIGRRRVGSDVLADRSAPVLDSKQFGPVLFNNPQGLPDVLTAVPRGRMAPSTLCSSCTMLLLPAASPLPNTCRGKQ